MLTCEVRHLDRPGQGVGLPSLISKHLEVPVTLLSDTQCPPGSENSCKGKRSPLIRMNPETTF